MNAPRISHSTPVHLALRQRPRLAENLAVLGAEPWERPGAPLRELFRNAGTLDRFLTMAATLPVPGNGSPWNDLPVSHLVDHLVQRHRDFLNDALPGIAKAFDEWDTLDPEVTELREDFARTVSAVIEEIANEESLFFPRVLRYEASLRDQRVNPEINGGSLRLAVAYRKSHSPGLSPSQFGRIAGRLRDTHAFRDGDPQAARLAERLDDFGAQFEEHKRLESELLFPIALEMETMLYNLSIAGVRTDVGVEGLVRGTL
jgi:iron-sulfur cluster repair protein YtfE (RIC family)